MIADCWWSLQRRGAGGGAGGAGGGAGGGPGGAGGGARGGGWGACNVDWWRCNMASDNDTAFSGVNSPRRRDIAMGSP